MTKYYTDEKQAQVLIALLKEHGINKVIASPGTTNMAFVGSIQNDSYFTIYSSVDERSAAYMACGMAAETGEPVVLSCTGATASRNYLPGLTEAYYRKLSILAITSSHDLSKVGHHVAQVIDRTTMPNDVAKLSLTLPIVKDKADQWECEIKINEAILELKRNGGGPVHINLPTTYSDNYNIKELPKFRKIERITQNCNFPALQAEKIAIYIASHKEITTFETNLIDEFCEKNNAIVLCDQTSNYKGKYKTFFSLVTAQLSNKLDSLIPDLFIHIGEISGNNFIAKLTGKQVWRVNEDGQIRDTFSKLRYIFAMPESIFFQQYTVNKKAVTNEYFQLWKAKIKNLNDKIPGLPFSNLWCAYKMAPLIPPNSTIHFGILNSLRSWNFFETQNSITTASNVGGFGIDGNVSTLIGASLTNSKKLFFGIVGDLAFFYDLNAWGNRHIGKNLRILLINNGTGIEFKRFNHKAAQFGEKADQYIAGAGHFGNKSIDLVKNYISNLGFKYLSAENKNEFIKEYDQFLDPHISNQSIVFEVFVNDFDDSNALEALMNIEEGIKDKTKKITKKIIGKEGTDFLKKVIRK